MSHEVRLRQGPPALRSTGPRRRGATPPRLAGDCRQGWAGPRRQAQPASALLWSLVATLLALVLVGCGAQAASPAAPTAKSLRSGELAIQAPATIDAGEPVQVQVAHAAAPDGLALQLVAQGSYGAQVYQAAFAGGMARILLPGTSTHQAGLVTLVALAGTARGEARLEIRPGLPAEPLTPLVGPRSIVADGGHWTMVVTVPFDRYGNMVADGTPVDLRVQHPDAQPKATTLRVRHGIAWQRIASRTRAGRTTLSVRSHEAHGPDATFQEVPGWPASFSLSATPTNLPADGRQFVTLRTTSIRDHYGNPLVDGTLVTFVVEGAPAAPRQIPAYTLDGVAEAQLQAPAIPGTLTVRATLFGIESAPLAIRFKPGPAVGRFPVTAHVNARADVVVLEAGPLLGPLDQFVPDGTEVVFRLSGAAGAAREVSGLAERGRARVELRLATLPPGAYTVNVVVGAGRGQTRFRVQ